MDFSLYTNVVLVRDVPEDSLQAGDIGTVVERHNVVGLQPGYSIEFFNMLGESVAVVTLPGDILRGPSHTDRPTVRSEAASGKEQLQKLHKT